jgi:hypothetical protein
MRRQARRREPPAKGLSARGISEDTHKHPKTVQGVPSLTGTRTRESSEQSMIVLPQETGEQPSLSSGLSDAPWLNHRSPGSLYSIVEYE